MDGPLDADLVHRSLPDATRQCLDRLDVLQSVPSTNSFLLDDCARNVGRFEVVLAEHQTKGRGRFNRDWLSPPGSGLCLSIAYTFETDPPQLASLTLAVGVAAAQALEQHGARGHRLKWPNDIMAGGGKLGGILTEALSGKDGSLTVVVGIGLNVNLGAALTSDAMYEFDYPVTDLTSCMDTVPSRSVIAAGIVAHVQRAIQRFETEGLEPFRHDWNAYDLLRGKAATVELPDSSFDGVADGIDAGGALRILTEQGRRRVFTGSVRLAKTRVAG